METRSEARYGKIKEGTTEFSGDTDCYLPDKENCTLKLFRHFLYSSFVNSQF